MIDVKFDSGILCASVCGKEFSFPRPADLVQNRFKIIESKQRFEIRDSRSVLEYAFGVLPFFQNPEFTIAEDAVLTKSAKEAFLVLVDADLRYDDFKVLRAEPEDYIMFAVRKDYIWKVCAISVKQITLTIRFEDLWRVTPKDLKKYLYKVEVLRDTNSKETGESVEQIFDNVAPDARIFLDISDNGGFVVEFK